MNISAIGGGQNMVTAKNRIHSGAEEADRGQNRIHRVGTQSFSRSPAPEVNEKEFKPYGPFDGKKNNLLELIDDEASNASGEEILENLEDPAILDRIA